MTSAVDLFEASIQWLREHYNDHCFFVERDVVWTIQKTLIKFSHSANPVYQVFNDFSILPGKRRSICADIALRDQEGRVELVAEFKYEPDHSRKDILPQKFPVVGWDGPIGDVSRVRQFVDLGRTPIAYAVFVDEGGFHRWREAPSGSTWIDWAKSKPDGHRVSVLWSKVINPLESQGH